MSPHRSESCGGHPSAKVLYAVTTMQDIFLIEDAVNLLENPALPGAPLSPILDLRGNEKVQLPRAVEHSGVTARILTAGRGIDRECVSLQ